MPSRKLFACLRVQHTLDSVNRRSNFCVVHRVLSIHVLLYQREEREFRVAQSRSLVWVIKAHGEAIRSKQTLNMRSGHTTLAQSGNRGVRCRSALRRPIPPHRCPAPTLLASPRLSRMFQRPLALQVRFLHVAPGHARFLVYPRPQVMLCRILAPRSATVSWRAMIFEIDHC